MGLGDGGSGGVGFFSSFLPLKPRHVLWSKKYGMFLKETKTYVCVKLKITFLNFLIVSFGGQEGGVRVSLLLQSFQDMSSLPVGQASSDDHCFFVP